MWLPLIRPSLKRRLTCWWSEFVGCFECVICLSLFFFHEVGFDGAAGWLFDCAVQTFAFTLSGQVGWMDLCPACLQLTQ